MSERILKINQLIKRELSQILLQKIDFPKQILVTVMRVETLKDLVQSKVYISVTPKEQILNVFKILNRQIYDIQQEINNRLKLRIVPKIRFVEEKEIEEVERVERIFKEIEKAKKVKRKA